MTQGARSKFSEIFRSSAVMSIATFSSRILGLVRELALAAIFGASGWTDAFNVAYRIPNMLRDLFAEGSFSAAFVPIFSKSKNNPDSEQSPQSLLWSSFILVTLMTGMVVIGIEIFAEQIVSLMTSQAYVDNTEKYEITVQLVRIMAPFLTLVSWAAIFMGALNTFKIFFIPAFAPVTFNVAMITTIVFGSKWFESKGLNPVLALGWGVLIGGAFQFMFQLPSLFKQKLAPQGGLVLWNKNSKEILHRLGIGSVGIATNQINIIVNTILATGTVVGAVSWLSYAFRLFQFPVGILSVSVANSNLVHFSEAWKQDKKEDAVDYFKTSVTFSIILIFFASMLLIVLSEPSVHLVFQRGAFGIDDTLQTQKVLKLYALGLPFYGLYKLLAPTFFAIDLPKLPVKVSMFSVSLNIIFCITLTPKYGFLVLPLGTTLSIFSSATILSVLLMRELKQSLKDVFLVITVKTFAAALLSGFLLNYLRQLIFNFDSSFIVKSGTFVALCLIGAVVYFGLLFLFGERKFLKKILSK
jgi:putative peptidoglycan lipid II flippase